MLYRAFHLKLPLVIDYNFWTNKDRAKRFSLKLTSDPGKTIDWEHDLSGAPYVAEKRLLKKPQIHYENDLEKISRSLHFITNKMMLLSSKFHVSELSWSKVTTVQSLTVLNDNHLKIPFLIIWYFLSTLPEPMSMRTKMQIIPSHS